MISPEQIFSQSGAFLFIDDRNDLTRWIFRVNGESTITTGSDTGFIPVQEPGHLHKFLLDRRPLCYGTKARVAKPGQRR
jgi:hypothetical protein